LISEDILSQLFPVLIGLFLHFLKIYLHLFAFVVDLCYNEKKAGDFIANE